MLYVSRLSVNPQIGTVEVKKLFRATFCGQKAAKPVFGERKLDGWL